MPREIMSSSGQRNVNIQHLITNIQKNPRFETLLMGIVSHDRGVQFNLDNEYIDELSAYGIPSEDPDGFCEIANPIYRYWVMKTFQPIINGAEREYFRGNEILVKPDNTASRTVNKGN